MQKFITSASFDWLLNSKPIRSELNDSADIPWAEIPMPLEVGRGGYESWLLTSGIHIYRACYKFQPEITGQLISLAKVSASFNEPTLMVHTLAKGRVIHKDAGGVSNDLIYGDGVDLFRFSKEISVIPVMDTSQEIDMVSLIIGESVLSNLIGAPLFARLVNNLGLSTSQAVVKSVPSHVHHSLQNCLKSEYSVALKKLWAQARVLDFITNLSNYFGEHKTELTNPTDQTRSRVRAVHEYLINLEGKLPSINSLASQFGCSARALNEEFQTEYGESMFSFIINHRLHSAHEAIKHSNIPLKQLAEKLGYAHVNHFSAAFKNKFGFPPSHLRKKFVV